MKTLLLFLNFLPFFLPAVPFFFQHVAYPLFEVRSAIPIHPKKLTQCRVSILERES